ncbi:MAG TPA: hypothetical protein VGO80_05480 [Solirubrobacteraceae bacterium]|jgi:hypothetical protein|nr:hypothetical protein [Solirubrobacteraceae bacterium]
MWTRRRSVSSRSSWWFWCYRASRSWTFLGSKIKLAQGIREAEALAAELEDIPAEAGDADPQTSAEAANPRPSGRVMMCDAAGIVDPLSAVAADRAVLIQSIVDLYRLVTAESDLPSIEDALTTLHARGYLDRTALTLADSVLPLTSVALQQARVTEADAASIRASIRSLTTAITRRAPHAFDDEVAAILRTVPDALMDRDVWTHGERRHRIDFTLRRGDRLLIVETAMPFGRSEIDQIVDAAARQARAGLDALEAFRAYIVLPPGASRYGTFDASRHGGIRVENLIDLRRRIERNTLFR